MNLIEAHQQVDKRRLACACTPHYRNLLSGLRLKADILHQQLARIVAKAYMLECNMPFGALCRRYICFVRDFLFLIKELKGTLRRGDGRLQRVDHIRSLGHRLGSLVHILEKRLHDADGHSSLDHSLSGDHRDHHMGDTGQQTDQRVHAVRQEVCLLAGDPVILRSRPHLLNTLFFMVIGLDYVSSLIIFLCNTCQDSDGLLSCRRALQAFLRNHVCHQYGRQHKEQEDQRQRHAVQKHNDQRADNGANRHNQFQKTGLQHLRHLIQVAGHTA